MQRIVSQYVDRPEVPKEERDGAMAYACDIWVRLVTPIAPHICEELWSKMKREGYVSLAPWPQADKKMIDLAAERAHEVVEATIRDVREIAKLLKEKTPKKVNIYVAPQWMFDAMDSVREANLPLIVGDIMKHLMSHPSFKPYGKEVKMIVDRMAKENGLWGYSASAKDEILTLQGSVEYLKSELGLAIVVQSAEKPQNDPQSKARFALPGRVSLFLE
jgi:leucyl-tRNA synthetase